jgi:hypothetical protein
MREEKHLRFDAESSILKELKLVKDARDKILDGTYPDKVISGRQRKHIPGTMEFEQKRRVMQERSQGSEPSILIADAEELVKKYKGTGTIRIAGSSPYPQETIDTGMVVGKTWVKNLNKYVDTKRIRIVYSSIGVHIIPVSDY